MVFSSVEFLFRFLPIFLVIYFLAKPEYRNVVLLLGSLFFYAYGEPVYVLLMIGSIVVNYVISMQIYRLQLNERGGRDTKTKQKVLLIASMAGNFGMLFLFKYLNFFIEILNGLIGFECFKQVPFTLPLGISFYTFQIASYLVDVYRKKYRPDGNLLGFATYVCMFPQLIAGPIVNYGEVEEQLKKRKVDFARIEQGTVIFVVGLAYKVLLANKIVSLWNDVQTVGAYGINTPTAWLGSWGYSMQIYFDFFGYSLMAIGLGKILGFHFPDNFVNPYCSKSATEFWRRWHITLGRWFREYVYIPLGGNRKGTVRMIFNTLVVWALTGLWHGANWNFIIWGLFFFVVLMIEKLFLLKYLDRSRVAGHVYMLVLIPISWTIFNITDLSALGLYLRRMCGLPIAGSVVANGAFRFMQLLQTYWWLLGICAFCCTPIPMKLVKKYHQTWICKAVILLLFWLSVYQLMQGGDNPFLYFRF